MTRLDTRLTGTQGLHLFFGGYLRGAKHGPVPPFEVAAFRVMPQPRLSSCGRAIEVHRQTTYLTSGCSIEPAMGSPYESARSEGTGPAAPGLVAVLICRR